MGSKEPEQTSPRFSAASLPDLTGDDDKTEIPGTPDRVKISNDTTTYTNSGHWTSILDGVSIPRSKSVQQLYVRVCSLLEHVLVTRRSMPQA
jgi:hypothetical protein